MLQRIVETLTQNPGMVQKLQAGELNLVGISESEKTAILDVFQTEGQKERKQGMVYWK
ncbi:competence protein [Pontibacillus halophilus JSM 076056 = DSM 19796]|uniref:ComX pheromone n=1 Tax=Pontibacillus halophilus JSM 076056 = DSM 19796 TaxID=1385510 RepID=A0A0A5GD11_9BACI|nr:competence pheromone ComX [Pontibacillus halophilus]KGX91096.1 competence protein [Pontibacillus halophilus JSM 076056 = DSM 19796]